MFDIALAPFSRRVALLAAVAMAIGATPGVAQTGAPTEAEVRRVNLADGKVTLRHGPIVSLDMPAMTMVFTARDPAMLQGLNVGEKVVFTPEYTGGIYYAVDIKKAP